MFEREREFRIACQGQCHVAASTTAAHSLLGPPRRLTVYEGMAGHLRSVDTSSPILRLSSVVSSYLSATSRLWYLRPKQKLTQRFPVDRRGTSALGAALCDCGWPSVLGEGDCEHRCLLWSPYPGVDGLQARFGKWTELLASRRQAAARRRPVA